MHQVFMNHWLSLSAMAALAALVAAVALLGPGRTPPVHADETEIFADCGDQEHRGIHGMLHPWSTKPDEGENYRVDIRPEDWLGLIRGHWYTIPGTATPGEDYVDVQGLYQEADRVVHGEFATIEDHYPEKTKSFTLRYVNAAEGGNDVECTIYIGNDDHGVLSARIIGYPPDGEAYRLGEVVTFLLDYSTLTDVEGDVRLEFRMGDGDESLRTARYRDGHTTDILYFTYQVQPGDLDLDGLSMDGGFVDDNGVTRGVVGSGSVDGFFNQLVLSPWFHGFDDEPRQKVDGRIAVTGIEVVSTPASGDTYGIGDTIEVAMSFSHRVQVEGDVMLNLRVGDESGNWRGAPYRRGSGSDTLVFAYTVQEGESDADGISVDGSWVDDEGVRHAFSGSGVIKLRGSDYVFVPRHGGLADAPAHKVDGRVTVTGIEVVSTPARADTYGIADTIQVAMSFSHEVEVEGDVMLNLRVGDESGNWRGAPYQSGSGTDTLVFAYTVQEGESDANGISVDGSWVDDDGVRHAFSGSGTLKLKDTDIAFTPRHGGLADAPAHKVDGVAPAIASISIVSSAGDDDTYAAGNIVRVAVSFDDVVFVNGSPTVELDLDGEAKTAEYRAPQSTLKFDDTTIPLPVVSVYFSYTVQVGDTDADGIAIGADALDLNGATIQDAAGNDAVLSHDALPADPVHKVSAPGGI